MTTEECPNASYFDPLEYPAGLDENCFPIDPCIPGGYTLNHLTPCELVPDTTEPVVEAIVAVGQPPVPMQQEMLPETGLSMFWVGWFLVACAAFSGGVILWKWANDIGQEEES